MIIEFNKDYKDKFFAGYIVMKFTHPANIFNEILNKIGENVGNVSNLINDNIEFNILGNTRRQLSFERDLYL